MRSKRWDPASDDLKGLLFEGAPSLLDQLDNLVLRPRRWWRKTLLPIIYLVCEPTAKNPLDGLADRLHQARGVLLGFGRATELYVFSEGMKSKCPNEYPHFLGGDAVARFVLDGRLKDFPGLIVDYLPQASSVAWGEDCRGASDNVGFFNLYQELFDDETCPSTRDGISILGYDALEVVTLGVRNSGVDRPSPDAVLRGIGLISGDGALSGASGLIDYPIGENQAIPRDKAILVLRGERAEVPKRILLCGQLETAETPPDEECPASSGP